MSVAVRIIVIKRARFEKICSSERLNRLVKLLNELARHVLLVIPLFYRASRLLLLIPVTHVVTKKCRTGDSISKTSQPTFERRVPIVQTRYAIKSHAKAFLDGGSYYKCTSFLLLCLCTSNFKKVREVGSGWNLVNLRVGIRNNLCILLIVNSKLNRRICDVVSEFLELEPMKL